MPKVNMKTTSSNDITVVYTISYKLIRNVNMKRAALDAINHYASKFINA